MSSPTEQRNRSFVRFIPGGSLAVLGSVIALAVPYVMDQVGHADSKTTLEIYAQVQKRVSRTSVHGAFDRLVNSANIDTVRSRF